MKVINVHQRLLHATPERVGALIDSLSSSNDLLWPSDRWPRLRFDRPIGVGAAGGHGPIRYFVEAYEPGQSIRCRFTGPRGFDGWHGFEILDATAHHCVLEHRIEMRTHGLGTLAWALFIGPMHDMALQDLLSKAQVSLGLEPQPVKWHPVTGLMYDLAMGGKRAALRRGDPVHAG